MFEYVSSYLNCLFDFAFNRESSLSSEFLFGYQQCVYLLSTLKLDVFRSASGKHLVFPCITRKDTYSINDEVYNLVDPFSWNFS